MKRICAFLMLILVSLSLVFSLTSCQGVEDINGARQTESILKTNYYETTLYADAKALATIGADGYLKYFLTAENDKGESIMICYCKTEGTAEKVLDEFEKMAAESDEDLLYDKAEKGSGGGVVKDMRNLERVLRYVGRWDSGPRAVAGREHIKCRGLVAYE